ncbi:hypothetical protein GALMADRAFT_144631 [Galerina marginata CBS 339.88]|uniref:Uncharacterized protein n=1 Tax=Galerina marginata (strain CBS 339.88) TaxID=685588 RepID=A0A067SJX3_GALM3|nr:hypothetical protein GALMADRAFT_144631 [Galerina marginata CBS 339.88]
MTATTIVAGMGVGKRHIVGAREERVEASSANAKASSFTPSDSDALNIGTEMVLMMEGGVDAFRSDQERIGWPADEEGDANVDDSGVERDGSALFRRLNYALRKLWWSRWLKLVLFCCQPLLDDILLHPPRTL